METETIESRSKGGKEMKELRKKIEKEVFGLPEGIVKTDNGDLLVSNVGTRLVHVYNLHKQKKERYPLKDFAPFVLKENLEEDIFVELLKYYC
jgi:hypothetical protein